MSGVPGQVDALASVSSLMERWNKECFQGSASPIEILRSLCEIVEQQTEVYFKTDPDPFDDRHPGRADPNCTLGHVLKIMLKHDDFIQTLAHTYLTRDQSDLNAVTCRALLNVMPGLEAFAVFKEHESSVNKLFKWAGGTEEPLRSYSIGILAYVMESQEHASTFKESNHKLVPVLMKRLQSIIQERAKPAVQRPFSQFAKQDGNVAFASTSNTYPTDKGETSAGKERSPMKSSTVATETAGDSIADAINRGGELSNSSWQEMEPLYIQSYQIFPVTEEVQQRLMLSYLTPMGEYQELLPEVFTNKAMDIVFHYLNYQKNCDIRLGFAAVRYLASLLCHKKFGIEFINSGGLEKFLTVPRPSLASTGLSLCLYYLAFFEDTMERVCIQPDSLLMELNKLVLWLLESSHQSGRMHAVMFLSNALTFKAFLDIFDSMDGLRKLYNVLSTSEILNADTDANFTDDQIYVSRQAIRHVTCTLKKYYESHASILADKIRQSLSHSNSRVSPVSSPEILPHKTMKMAPELLTEDIQLLLQCMSKKYWKPAAMFKKMNGVELFLKTITLVADWPAYNGKAESIRWLLDTLNVCSVYPPVQLDLCKVVNLPDRYNDSFSSPGLSILLGMADTDILCEAEVQTSALNVIINLVCAPSDISCSAPRRNKSLGSSSVSVHSPFLQSLWDEFRQNNGIMVLLKLLTIQTPLTGADAIRALACQALVGLSRSDTMCQIMSKLPLFNDGQLLALMKEPVLQDKRYEQIKFCKYASQLIERVCGRPQNITDVSLEHIRKAEVVQQTRIIYKEKELLQLVYDHLLQKGLEASASALQKEANLTIRTSASCAPQSTQFYEASTSHSTQHNHPAIPRSSVSTPSTPGPCSSGMHMSTPSTPGGLRFHLKNSPHSSQTHDTSRQRLSTSSMSSSKSAHSKQDMRSFTSNVLSKKTTITTMTDATDNMTLDKIVTSYFRKQHALCKNPVVTCPPFSVYEPHVCPEPARKSAAPVNLTARVLKHSVHLNYGGSEGSTFNRKFKYSRYKPIKTYKDSESGVTYSCCAFSACEQWLMLGNYSGDLKLYSIQAGEEAETYNCHNSPLTQVEPSRDGMLLLTSSSWSRPLSALWSMDNFFDQKVGFDEDQYVEFSKCVQDRIIGTAETKAHVYDVATGVKISTFYDENKSNNYVRNQATFNCTDDLVLSDGVLWDVDSGKAIHKFDKFNPQVSGLFHPLGLEVVINSEIWDLRTFKLLHTVPALNQCLVRFSNDSSILYASVIAHDDEEEEGSIKRNPYGSSFRTFDSRNYSCLATTDLQRSITDICTDKSDMYLAVIESHKDNDTLQEDCQCRLYEVGAVKNTDEMPPEEDDEDEGGEEDDDDEDDDDDGEDGGSDEILELVDDMDAEEEELADAESIGTSDTTSDEADSDLDDDDADVAEFFINASDLSDSEE
ncbi:DDB1- and CUL4-associated factor 1-like isoform X1 [Watersipora subatra]|uniref:DDB1- and CUL4-associated factor 1-like isoform X1 n=1 Tax=Watersipora subatra TaxID=2589382 RepID=UPI00355B082C